MPHRLVTIVSIAFWSIGHLLHAQEAGLPELGKVLLPDAVRFVNSFSSDGRAGTMLFDNFVLSTQVGRGTLPNAEIKKFTYVLQPKTDKPACLVQFVRGFVSVNGTGSVMMAVHSGGESFLVDFSKAIESSKHKAASPVFEALRNELKQKAQDYGLRVSGRLEQSEDFVTEIKTHVGVNQPIQTTLLLLVDRTLGEQNSAAIHIDSIDFEIFPIADK